EKRSYPQQPAEPARKKTVLGTLRIIKRTFSEYMSDHAFRLSAALAYYLVLSLAPLVLVIVGVAGLIWGEQAVRGAWVQRMHSFIGQAGAEVIQNIIKHASYQQHDAIAIIVGAVTLLVGAMAVFIQLQEALNTIWKVKPKKGRSIWVSIRLRFMSLAMVLGLV